MCNLAIDVPSVLWREKAFVKNALKAVSLVLVSGGGGTTTCMVTLRKTDPTRDTGEVSGEGRWFPLPFMLLLLQRNGCSDVRGQQFAEQPLLDVPNNSPDG